MTLSQRRSAVVLVAACALCYSTAIGGAFHYDDFHSIVENRAIRDPGNIPRFFVDPTLFSADAGKAMYRPVLLATYALNYAAAGYDAASWEVTNLALHTIAVLLLWALARRLLGDGWGALMTGLLFAVHPLTSEPVNYVISRSELLAAALYLAAFLTYVRARGGESHARLSLACFCLALLSKSTAITLPLALLAYELTAGPARIGWAGTWQKVRSLGAYWTVAVGYVGVIAANGFLGSSLADPVRSTATQLATQLKAPAYYLKLLFVPWGQSVEHQFSVSASLLDGPVLVGGALCLSLLAVALLALRWQRRPLPGYAVLWSALSLLPTSLMPLNVLVNERRVYLVVAALGLGLGALLRCRERWMVGACLPLLAVLTWSRNPVWATELSLWQDAALKAPDMPRVQMNLGKALQHDGQWEAALAAYQRALELDPGRGDAYNNIGTLLHGRGDLDRAIAWYRRGIHRHPEETDIHLNLAQALAARGDLNLAQETYRQALALDPGDGTAWSNYSESLLRSGAWSRAEAAARRAIELAPERPEPYNNLANALSSRGDDAGAVEAYGKALARAEEVRGPILANLGDSYRRLGDLPAARMALGKALLADPDLARAHYYLGRVEVEAGRLEAASEALRLAAALDSGHVGTALTLAEVEANLGRPGYAVRRLQRAVALEPGNARAWYTLAELLDSLGQSAEAQGAYRRFLDHWDLRDGRYRRAAGRIRALEGGD